MILKKYTPLWPGKVVKLKCLFVYNLWGNFSFCLGVTFATPPFCDWSPVVIFFYLQSYCMNRKFSIVEENLFRICCSYMLIILIKEKLQMIYQYLHDLTLLLNNL